MLGTKIEVLTRNSKLILTNHAAPGSKNCTYHIISYIHSFILPLPLIPTPLPSGLPELWSRPLEILRRITIPQIIPLLLCQPLLLLFCERRTETRRRQPGYFALCGGFEAEAFAVFACVAENTGDELRAAYTEFGVSFNLKRVQ